MLCYGFRIEWDDSEYPEEWTQVYPEFMDEYKFRDWAISQFNYKLPEWRQYDKPEDYYNKQESIYDDIGVELVKYRSAKGTIAILAARGSVIHADDDAEEVDIYKLSMQSALFDQRIKHFCSRLKIPVKELHWFICPSYSD